MCDVCIFSYISIMSTSRPFDMIMDLNDSKYLWKIALRITDIWYVQLPPKPGHLEMILMDSKGDRIQVSVRKDQFNEWREHLVESSTYVMHNFNVMHNDIQFKACDHVYRMQFTAGTTLKQREFPDIPEWEYDFKKFGDILDGNGRNDLLIDIIGAFDKVIFSQTQGNLKKVVFSLKDFSGDFINYTLWESHATKFEKHYNNHCNVEPMIILLTHARIKEGQGKYPHSISNSWCGSKILIGEEIPNIDKYKQRYKLDIKVIHQHGSGRFVFWDCQCADIIGVSASDLRDQMVAEGEDDPKAFSLILDELLARTMALRVKVQPSYNQSSVIRLSEDPNLIKNILDQIVIFQSVYITADHDPDLLQVLTPAKRLSADIDVDLIQSPLYNSTQLSSSKVAKHINID
ncbi:putative nucleic acid-binding protein [Lupinus albus]|uniref:Putative nucleic acid-binding protein n=1 Tax=Lupinus albus TaxID=3870 RepID=A0A6A4PRB7_LUPAL|nr:putative nucleic acid-binding protein [Lupinus albus]